MSTLQKVALSTVAAVLFVLSAATMKADDHFNGTELNAVGVGSVPLTFFGNPNCQGFTAYGTLSDESIGKASFTLTVGNPNNIGGCAAGGGARLGALTLTTKDGSTLAMDVAVTTSDGGESYMGTFSAPNNVSGPNGEAITTAVSSGDFRNVVGAGTIVFGTGYNPNTNTYGTTQTIYLGGTLGFPSKH